jgi:predicted DNA-binding transcriptional regulator YafY
LDTLLRQWAMLRLIPRHPRKIDSASLQRGLHNLGYEINVRTIQRDLNKLSSVLPLLSDQSKPQGWWWQADADVLDMPGLDPQSALVFKMAEQHLSKTLPSATLESLRPWFKAANGVLEKQAGGTEKWLNNVRIIPRGQPLLPPVVDPVVQEVVYRALFESKKLAIRYLAHRAPQPHDFEVNPIALVQRDHLIYIVCTLGESTETRLLVMHRMQSARLLDTLAVVPDDFDLDAYIAAGGLGYQVGSIILLEAELTAAVAAILTETPLSADQALQELSSGRFHLTASVADTKELRAWLRGFGRNIRIISPDTLLGRR